jgi:hypothetical protein
MAFALTPARQDEVECLGESRVEVVGELVPQAFDDLYLPRESLGPCTVVELDGVFSDPVVFADGDPQPRRCGSARSIVSGTSGWIAGAAAMNPAAMKGRPVKAMVIAAPPPAENPAMTTRPGSILYRASARW